MLIDAPGEIGGRLWMLGNARYPMYLDRGPHAGAIIEGGISALGPALQRQFAELAIGPEYVRQLIVTHAHPDHVMALPALRACFPQATVIASKAAAATLNVEKAVAFFKQIDAALTEGLAKAGVMADAAAAAPAENRIAVDRVVQEGDAIEVDGRRWTVLETPGHSDCSISLHDAAQGVLVISDAAGYCVPASGVCWPNYFTSYAAYRQSLEKLSKLDAEILCLSHNGALRGRDDIRRFFAGAIEATDRYHERIVQEAKAGKPARTIAEELGKESHALAPVLPVEFFQKNCGLLVKQSLKHAGIEGR